MGNYNYFINEDRILTNNNDKRMSNISDFIDHIVTVKKQKVTIGL